MAHFAQLSDNNVVTSVIVVNNTELMDGGAESESKGVAFCQALFGGRWIQTSYNARFRKHFAGIGFRYDTQRDAFIPPQPFASWTLDNNTCEWVAPVPHPSDGKAYVWQEDGLRWSEVT